MKTIMRCLVVAIATIITQSAAQMFDRGLFLEKNINQSNHQPPSGASLPNSFSTGRFTLKPDNNGHINFDTTLAKNLQYAIDSIQLKNFPKYGISAALLIPGKGTWMGVSGYSTQPNSIKPEMLFHIGSNTKGFISAIMLQLQEEGKLSLDDSIGSYLPPYTNISGSITIRQLLSMTSGLFDCFNSSPVYRDSINANVDRIWMPEEMLTKFVGPPRKLPGGLYQYCNTNLIIAGLIVQKITKSTISKELHERILTPLSLTHTYFPEEDSVIGTIPTPWYSGTDNSVFCRKAYHSMIWTAGAIVATAEDAVRWSSALYGGQILNASSQEQFLKMNSSNVSFGNGFIADGYGLCVRHLSYFGKELLGHDGVTHGFNSNIMYYPKTGISLAALCNSFGPDYPADEAMSALLHEYFKTIPTANVSTGKSFVLGGDSAYTYDLNTLSANITPMGKSRYGTILNCRIRPGTNELYGISSALGVELVQIDGTTGEAYPRKVIKFPGTVVPDIKGMAFKSADTLYIGSFDGKLFMVNFQSGITTQVASTGLVIAGLDFNPKSGQLWASSRHTLTIKKDLIYKINLPSGDTVRVGATGFSQKTTDISFDQSGNLYGLIGSETQINRLAQIDTATGVGTIIGSFGISSLKALLITRTVNSVAETHSQPSEFLLEQNYPNPFNPSTVIRYQIPVNSMVSMKIYDLLGREIATLVNEEQSTGWKEVLWNASAFSSGIYFYRLTAGNYVGVKKLMLLK